MIRRRYAVARAFRDERAAVLATLIRHVGDFQLAEDAVQDAYAAALSDVAARRRSGESGRVAHGRLAAARDRSYAPRPLGGGPRRAPGGARAPRPQEHPAGRGSSIVDDRLRLIFTCCHPALDMAARVGLTLRAVGGLTTGEIARAFLVAEPTMGKRIVRRQAEDRRRTDPVSGARRRGAAGPSCAGCSAWSDLIFNEGYSATEGERLVREELCGEAIRLGLLLRELMPDDGRGVGTARADAPPRLSARCACRRHGRYLAIDEQDRSRWDRKRASARASGVGASVRLRRPGQYQLQAAITAVQMEDRPRLAAGRRPLRRAR